ncbi:MAG: IS200/IS605 family transposase [Deltaproteobacteria bacterium]|nr:IS200/IS605 family transposase [Deltaproteobacteria bacterium]MBN2672039.1 IS200/IS605 family transposase [Deltaproteobacteria bacterium]
MKQRHSFSDLLYHLVLRTKNREHLIVSEEDENRLCGFFKKKAHDLDAYIEEFGTWYDHVHILLRTKPTHPLSDVYGQLKGFAAYAWQKNRPTQPFKWNDGVWIVTVSPNDCDILREYIRNQRIHHSENQLIPCFEPENNEELRRT